MLFARNIATVGGATLVSRVLGFLRDAAVAALLGAGPISEALLAVLQLVNLFRRLLAEGALNGAFAPIWLRLRQSAGICAANRFTLRVLLIGGCVVIVAAALVWLAAPRIIALAAPGFRSAQTAYAVTFLSIVTPYIALAGTVAIMAAALSAEGGVKAGAASTVVFNLVLLLVLAVTVWPMRDDHLALAEWLAGAVVIAGLVQLAIVLAMWLRRRSWKAPTGDVSITRDVRRFFARALPGVISAGIPQLKLIAGAAIASSSASAVSWLYYANRLYELPLGVISVAIASVIVPRIAAATYHERALLTEAKSRGFEIALALSLPATAGFAILAEPIAGALFQRGAFGAADTAAVALALAALCGGLPGHAMEKVLAAVSFAHEDTRTPMITALLGLAGAIIGAMLLFPHYGHAGVAGAIALSAWGGAALQALTLLSRGRLHLDATARRRLPRIVLSTAIMSAVVLGGRWLLDGQALLLEIALLVPLGMLIYLVAIQGLGVAHLPDLVRAVRRKA